MNYEKSSHWLSHTKSFPTCHSTVELSMDNAPYHGMTHNEPSGKYARKQDMVDWLWVNGSFTDISVERTIMYGFSEKLKL
jgi:hypothetical protein